MQIFNQYSMLLTGIFILGLAAFVVWHKGINSKNGIMLVALGAMLFVTWLVLRPEQASTSELGEFQPQIGQGQAVLVELQSPY